MKDTLRTAVIAAFAVLAIAFAAATLDSTVGREDVSPDGASGGAAGPGESLPPPPLDVAADEALQIPFLAEILTLVVFVALLVVAAYAIRHWRDTLRAALASVVLFVLLFALSQLLFPQAGLPPPPATEAGSGGLAGGGGGGEGEVEPIPASSPPPLLLLVVGLALVGALLALFRGRTDGDDDAASATEPATGSAAAVGRTAGRAADRLEGESDVDNEIYRAWREMTGLLDVSRPETSTPGEFADAAAEAGLGREDVRELTRLFEDVRYGDVSPSDEHERRALEVFRRIEDRYAEGEP